VGQDGILRADWQSALFVLAAQILKGAVLGVGDARGGR